MTKHSRSRQIVRLIDLVAVAVILALAALYLPDAFGAPATVLRVIDGDTITARSDRGVERIRLRTIDAPELSSATECERQMAAASRDALAGLVQGATVDMTTHGLDRYGRTLATLTLDGQDVGQWMMDHGYAIRYRASRRGRWC